MIPSGNRCVVFLDTSYSMASHLNNSTIFKTYQNTLQDFLKNAPKDQQIMLVPFGGDYKSDGYEFTLRHNDISNSVLKYNAVGNKTDLLNKLNDLGPILNNPDNLVVILTDSQKNNWKDFLESESEDFKKYKAGIWAGMIEPDNYDNLSPVSLNTPLLPKDAFSPLKFNLSLLYRTEGKSDSPAIVSVKWDNSDAWSEKIKCVPGIPVNLEIPLKPDILSATEFSGNLVLSPLPEDVLVYDNKIPVRISLYNDLPVYIVTDFPNSLHCRIIKNALGVNESGTEDSSYLKVKTYPSESIGQRAFWDEAADGIVITVGISPEKLNESATVIEPAVFKGASLLIFNENGEYEGPVISSNIPLEIGNKIETGSEIYGTDFSDTHVLGKTFESIISISWKKTKFWQYYPVIGNFDTIASISENIPALVETNYGNGRILFCCVGLLPNESTLMGSVLLVPFLQETINYLGASKDQLEILSEQANRDWAESDFAKLSKMDKNRIEENYGIRFSDGLRLIDSISGKGTTGLRWYLFVFAIIVALTESWLANYRR